MTQALPSPALLAQAQGLSAELVALRRAIHAEPELGLMTPMTRDKIRLALAHLPIVWREGPSTTGLVGVLRGGGGPATGPRPTVLLRADTDALPMAEETGLPYASRHEGVMHACGHDSHVAMLAGAAELLAARADDLAGDVLLMFQPGEEGHHGARFMIEDGLIEAAPGVWPDAAFALHVMPNSPHGRIAGRVGALLAGADQIDIAITGAGGHASMPHDARDPVPVACEIVTALQTMVTRQFDAHDPVVVTIARIEAGTTHNVIPDTARMKGTMRSLSPVNRQRLRDCVRQLVTGIAAAHGLQAELVVTPGFPVTLCDARAVDLGAAVSADMFGPDAFVRLSAPIMGAEDFAYVLEHVPGAMFFIGAAHQGSQWASCCGIHSPRMVIDESIMPRGSALLAGCALRYLARGWD
ncbi:amidohydrolase [Novosphingobium sp. FSY-8]|uniref:Amidohydrolase n=1 Tax=Novosphingobium ovatum TaxID=1908523 RepID=A0ABW9XHB3_9SPHN|nr:M20 family metallopeptidase [Novosphingobium ovatum]NBC37886.1 amidohydrolase [Novosphingobium ovatum]